MNGILYSYNNLQEMIKELHFSPVSFIKKDPAMCATIKYLAPLKSDTEIKRALDPLVGSIKFERPKENFLDIFT